MMGIEICKYTNMFSRYGDKVPVTIMGRLIGVTWMMISVLFTASVTSIITGRFSDYNIDLENKTVREF